MGHIEATREGAEALRKLANDLQNSNNDLEACCNTLKNTVNSLNGLGDFAPQILDIVEQISGSQAQGREAVDQLCGKLSALASRVESICSTL